MSVAVRIPTILRSYTGGEARVEAEGSTLGEVLESLDASYAGIRRRIVDEQNQLRRYVPIPSGRRQAGEGRPGPCRTPAGASTLGSWTT